jgi:transposase
MKKHTEQFKLAIVEQYLTGLAGYKTLSHEHDVARSLIRRWVAFHRHHGVEGLKSKTARYSADFKLSVLQHMWKAKLSYAETAALFNVRGQCNVGIWERSFRDGGIVALSANCPGNPIKTPAPKKTVTPPSAPLQAPDDQTRSREDLVIELNQLRMEVAYLKKLKALVLADQQAATRAKRK